MASSDVVPVEQPATEITKPTVTRKRRRRAAATGATEDCFTCRKRQTKCDRKRPYCSQCLDIGNECSGYRTTLTWGIGVASRGKLRGLSLPVVNSAPSVSASPRGEAKSKTIPSSRPAVCLPPLQVPEIEVKSEPFSPMSASHTLFTNSGYETVDDATANPIPIPTISPPQFGWHVPGFHEHVEKFNATAGKPKRSHPRPRTLQRLQTSISTTFDDSITSAPSTGSLSTFSDSDFPSPSEFPQTPDDLSLADPFMYPYPDTNMIQDSMQPVHRLAFLEIPRSYPVAGDDMSSSISSDQSGQDFDSINSGLFGSFQSEAMIEHDDGSDHKQCYSPSPQWSLPTQPLSPDNSSTMFNFSPNMLTRAPQVFSTLSFYHLPPRMQYLLDYYEKAICPVLVAYDGPSNPYRLHVMRQAMHSEALQNAIAALSTNNMRMRGLKEISRIGFQSSSPALTADEISSMAGPPSQEEVHYKTTSIALLNSQLASPATAKDDSVLATLLILCLFHVCDSGFAQFKTQLAGVQKLLSLRDPDQRLQSSFVGWVEMFFTWFDVMTSTCNDRETEIKGDSLNLMDLSSNLGALEHLAGCEGRLFKLIARLGRLNLLSQSRPVRDPSPAHITQSSPPRTTSITKDYYSIGGNSWGISSAETNGYPDSRVEFWSEWHLIRQLLQDWSPISSSPTATTDPSLNHISNSFRYSALLYTERLANPSLSPSAPSLQHLVSASLSHLRLIPPSSCMNKFLLWPLFVTGTECVGGCDRQLVRVRIGEVMRESGFFNNLSGLEVLERVWCEDDERAVASALAGMHSGLGVEDGMKQAFRWRKAMEGREGEFVVV